MIPPGHSADFCQHRPPGLLVRCRSYVRPLDLIVWGAGITLAAAVTAVGATWVVLRDIDVTNTLLCGDDDD